MLYEVVTGRPPHEADGMMAMMSNVLISEPDIGSDVDPEMARILRRALQREPDARFESAEQVRLALAGFLQHRGSRRLANEAIERLGDLEGLIARSDASTPELHSEIHHLDRKSVV